MVPGHTAYQLTEKEEHYAEAWRIRYYCALKGWLQKDLAFHAHLTKAQVNLITTGHNITRSTSIKICRALGIARWKLCKMLIPKVRKLEAKFKNKKRKDRKEKGLKGG